MKRTVAIAAVVVGLISAAGAEGQQARTPDGWYAQDGSWDSRDARWDRQRDDREAWREREKDEREARREWEKDEREAQREWDKERREAVREGAKERREAIREREKARREGFENVPRTSGKSKRSGVKLTGSTATGASPRERVTAAGPKARPSDHNLAVRETC